MGNPTLLDIFDEAAVQHMKQQVARGVSREDIGLDIIKAAITVLANAAIMEKKVIEMNEDEWLHYRMTLASSVIDVIMDL